MFNPHAASNRNTTIERCYTKHEKEKKRAYEQRVREIEHASFTPLVMSASGGFAKEATNFYKMLAVKWDQPYSRTTNWLRCTISFALLRSAIQCIRGARSHQGHAFRSQPVDLATTEARITEQPLTFIDYYYLYYIYFFVIYFFSSPLQSVSLSFFYY